MLQNENLEGIPFISILQKIVTRTKEINWSERIVILYSVSPSTKNGQLDEGKPGRKS